MLQKYKSSIAQRRAQRITQRLASVAERVRRFPTASIVGAGLTPVTQFAAQRDLLIKRSCGHIVVEQTRLLAVHGRWFPYFGSLMEVAWDQRLRQSADRCEIFFHVPWTAPQFITLSYIRSGALATPATVKAATIVLDEIARLKQAAAIVAHVTNDKISQRALERWGWEQHCESRSGRHFIKRFYGKYPTVENRWKLRLGF